MSSVLTQEYKKKINKEYRFRLFSVALFMIAAAIVAGIVLLVPSYIGANNELDTLNYQIEVTQEAGEEVVSREVQLESRRTRELLAVWKEREANIVDTSPLISEVLSASSSSIDMTRVSWESSEGGHVLRLSGIASDRQQLSSFADRLRALEVVETVDLPVASLAQATDIIFSITVKFVQAEEEIEEDDSLLEDNS